MTLTENPRPGTREPDGVWARAFSYHPFSPVLERAEGIYLYDEDGNRYIDVSGGPMAVNLGHGDRRVIEAMTKQAEKFAYCHPVLSNRPSGGVVRADQPEGAGEFEYDVPGVGRVLRRWRRR